MNCRQAKEYLDHMLSAGPDPISESALAEHVMHCGACRSERETAMQALTLLQPSAKPQTSTDLKERIMNAIVMAQREELHKVEHANRGSRIWKPILAIGLTAALALLIAPLFFSKSYDRVYALEQSVEANRSLRSIHMKMTPENFGSVGEIWVQFDENGNLQRLRMNFPNTEDGPKDVVWGDGKAEIWFKAKGGILVVKEPRLLEILKMSYGDFDPKNIVERVYKSQSDPNIKVDVKESPAQDGLITITVAAKDAPQRQDVYTVDPQTKLLKRRDIYRLRNGSFELEGGTEYLEYNESIDPAVFTLEAPDDVLRIDQTAQEVGLDQRNLSDHEIAVKVVREFFEALIAKDYAKAGQLMEGLPATEIEKTFGPFGFIRVISIGEPEPYAPNQSLRVPCKIEVQRNGETSVFEPKGPFVRQVYQQPHRWSIIGGI